MSEYEYAEAFASKQGVVVFDRDKGFRHRVLINWSFIFVGGAMLLSIMSSVSLAQAVGSTVIVMIMVFGMFESIYRWSKNKRIEVDFELDVVRLYDFRYPCGFWDIGAKKLVEVRFDDFLYVEYTSSKIESVIVHTKQSKFCVMETFEKYPLLVSLLSGLGDSGKREVKRRKRTTMIEYALTYVGAGAIAFMIIGLLGYLLGWI